MSIERTFAMLKPGVLQRRLMGEIISRFEKKGFAIRACAMRVLSEKLLRTHYREHEGKYFYEDLISSMQNGPVICLVLEAPDAIRLLRQLCGPTVATDAPAGSIRGDYCAFTRFNLVHASDSPESAAREISLFFSEDELYDWDDPLSDWIYDRDKV